MSSRIAVPAPPRTAMTRVAGRARAAAWAVRRPALRGLHLDPGDGAWIGCGPQARITGGEHFHARGDLTLVVEGRLSIGRGVFFNRGAHVVAFHDVHIGDQVRFGESVSVHDENHVIEPMADQQVRFGEYDVAPVWIGDRVLVGAHTTILAGARIGDDAVIGAGSLVRGEIPPGVLAAGVPARVIRTLA
ncbi:MAG TPA: acyltransferase [Mycobacteriales bacterium]|nr:acyltransferase [Mycobacteriales bacterium]